MRVMTLFKILGGVVVVVVVAAIIVLMNMDFDRFKGDISALVQAQTGRSLTIGGKLSLAFLPAPALSASNLAISNAAWGSQPQMARIGRLEAEVELLPLLFRGRVKVSRLILRDVDLLLETNRQGQGNWQFANASSTPESGSAALSVPDFQQVQLDNIAVTYHDGITNRTNRLVLRQLEANGRSGRPLQITARAAIDRAPVRLQAELGPLSELLEPKRPYPVQVTISMLGANARIQGTMAQPLLGHGLDIGLSVSVQDPGALAALAGIELPSKPAHAAAQVRGDADKTLTIEKLDAGFGTSAMTGEATLSVVGDRPKLTAKLQAPMLDLTEIAGAGEPKSRKSDGRLFSDQPLPMQALGLLDADISLDAAQIRTLSGPLEQLHMRLVLKDRRLELKPISANMSGGRFIGALLVGGREEPATVKLDFSAQQIEVGPLLKRAAGKDLLQNKADFSADLSGSGNSVRALMASLNGKTDLTMGKGQIHSGYVDLIAADVLRQIAPWANQQGDTTMNCMVSRFDIDGGIATSRGMLMDTGNETIQGEGTIDLRSERLDLVLRPRPKEASLISLATPIDVRGTLANPTFAPDSLSVAKGVAGAAIGAAINPLGVLIPFVSGGSGDKNPCLAALQEGKSRSGTANGKSPPKAKEGGIGGFLRGLGRDIDRTLNGK